MHCWAIILTLRLNGREGEGVYPRSEAPRPGLRVLEAVTGLFGRASGAALPRRAWASLSARPRLQVKPLLPHEGDEDQVAGHDPQPGHQPQLLAVDG